MTFNKFDLNVEKILEDWEVYHAVREIIANAIDEELLTKTKKIEIFKDKANCWHIRDYGRGLNHQHLTQKENDEKLKNPHVIGKFGIGLKDALATFNRKGVQVSIKSKHEDITLERTKKHGFDDIITLHAQISPPSDNNFQGTEFILKNCSDSDISRAKDLFLRFSGEKVLETTSLGQVIKKKSDPAKIYVNGVQVAEEENFLFSYNITALNKAIQKALNRERTNVGRTAYADRVQKILTACESQEVAHELVNDLANYDAGEHHDELGWSEVSVHACRLLNDRSKVVFFTSDEAMSAPNLVDRVRNDKYDVIIVPQKIKGKLQGAVDVSGNPIRDVEQFSRDWNNSLKFSFVSERQFTAKEKQVFEQTGQILDFVGGRPECVKEILISKTMRLDPDSYLEVGGLWEASENRIIIKRDQLKDIQNYAGILLHEVAHATSDASDVSRSFENELTRYLGLVAEKAIRK
ncbi:ATP-binding protein [Methanoculleus oceani]|uniref:ATP-binding protein n=1 Tax=Methanoculleus oceani TaxID=2184756 RepID=A0ABD4TEE2_9EURY|nr:ATP-binding protein [Methanoculleus sp. CWC-02]MCM2466685.1 ATP-binding protein [Methanoculleus sp. CWC-02]